MREIVFSVLLLGCTGFGDFAVSVPLPEIRIPGQSVPTLVDQPLDVAIDEDLGARGTGPAHAAHLIALTFAITRTAEPDGDSDDFGFVDHTAIFIESNRVGSMLERTQVAEHGPGSADMRTIDFETDPSIDLVPYLSEGARFTSNTTGRYPPDDVTFKGTAVLSLDTL